MTPRGFRFSFTRGVCSSSMEFDRTTPLVCGLGTPATNPSCTAAVCISSRRHTSMRYAVSCVPRKTKRDSSTFGGPRRATRTTAGVDAGGGPAVWSTLWFSRREMDLLICPFFDPSSPGGDRGRLPLRGNPLYSSMTRLWKLASSSTSVNCTPPVRESPTSHSESVSSPCTPSFFRTRDRSSLTVVAASTWTVFTSHLTSPVSLTGSCHTRT
mmetsp:Transcript_29015/g.81175  ORF Transcript_29015/g.81175 Transcript_29015/m.81175 type:complete len:212 (-) Transcript_29015:81-716(-)